ncbi:thioesterase family protein [Rhodococcus sp. BP-349]|uniref:thioesterase family protein n=1 Tax=unclassified Rhodococcus (in: high G+C Gram-positive bacteria) TaxID=192944 RepID=UPI001C9B10E0|nr:MULTISPECIES: thioesterase family protein [unclassified Rhodococcus (in: high G+C Gram-positive bacteria)]MBY6541252.1 thioesterase family protein [Rhodococcus sp. BP-363]MBY6544722.1 thioesterase family protein [Rhodococcus sp. BP-369]MBY6563952.1 thioesterase family protein [Rhodococcus sp. BP-370]MBY6579111.1 thioesterase family protein [Rhodococcus sp. BP-364]MBY6588412.1 thioesterase family protein [Rhodococcus sp. BP-358]
MSEDALFVPVEETGRYRATRLTTSVWAETMQHGAPPSALLARALEQCSPMPGTRLARVTMEILGPIPVGELAVQARVERPGRRVAMLSADLVADLPDGSTRAVARATAWRVAMTDTSAAGQTLDPPLVPGPDESEAGWAFPDHWHGGFLDSLEFRGARPVTASEPGRVWARPKYPVVAGEKTSPIVGLFAVADIANGVAALLDPTEWTFLNTDLTVQIVREPVGEWVGVQARTAIGDDGIGLCTSTLYDATGSVGRTFQTLEVRARP